ncbi:MAG: DUF697 domain-containing protein [Saprospiraceae bacterium]|nr:DUF697 domain-containing protein [Saprospiraceae bacterium]
MKETIRRYATKKLKEQFMDNNTGGDERGKHAETIIRNHVIWSMGASFVIVVPVADIFAVSAIQLDMVRQLSRVYGLSFSETQGKAIVTALTSSTLARAGARSLIKLLPGIGTVIGGVTVSIFNGASTYALGEVFKQHFSAGGTFLDFDTERLKKYYNEKFEKGKKVAEQLRKEQAENPGATPPPPPPPAEEGGAAAAGNTLDRLRELADLRNQGIISEEEFEQMKKALIDQFK